MTQHIYDLKGDYTSLVDNARGTKVRAVFLDISKAFGKVWHEGLGFKMKCNGIQGELLSLLSDFLDDRYQRTILNGKTSEWAHVEAAVPQGSVLAPYCF